MQALLQHFHQLGEQSATPRGKSLLDDDEAERSEDIGVFHAELDQIILIDRTVDMITPFCQQLTYEGLIDEFLHIRHGPKRHFVLHPHHH